jgi:peptide/nickel transport system substrate-binding protein
MFPQMFATYHSASATPEFNLDTARQLLEAEGFNTANPLRFETMTFGAADPVIEAYQAVLRSIGVEMSITNLEFGVFLQHMMRGEYHMLAGGWNNTTGNELSSMANYWTGSFGQSNISFFTHERADELYEMALRTTDMNVIMEAAREVQELGAWYVPMFPTFRSNAYYAMINNLRGVDMPPNALVSFRRAYLAE